MHEAGAGVDRSVREAHFEGVLGRLGDGKRDHTDGVEPCGRGMRPEDIFWARGERVIAVEAAAAGVSVAPVEHLARGKKYAEVEVAGGVPGEGEPKDSVADASVFDTALGGVTLGLARGL